MSMRNPGGSLMVSTGSEPAARAGPLATTARRSTARPDVEIEGTRPKLARVARAAPRRPSTRDPTFDGVGNRRRQLPERVHLDGALEPADAGLAQGDGVEGPLHVLPRAGAEDHGG